MLRALCYTILTFSPSLLIAQQAQGKKYFDNDSLRISEIFHYSTEDSTLEGSYESFHLNGSLSIFGWYKNDLPDSLWIYYYENGRKKAEGQFREGIKNGRWKHYFENGNIRSYGYLKGEIKQGKWGYYFENGTEKISGQYENDKKTGLWNYSYEDGSIKAQVIYQNGAGNFKEFYPFGSLKMEGITLNDKSEGEWLYYYESGELEAIGNFKKGLRVGTWSFYHKNGNKKAEGDYLEGKRNGEWQYFHENGVLSKSGQILQDQKQGSWKLYYPTGDFEGEVKFDDGKGNFESYYINGGKKSEGKIINDKKEGHWIYYAENGHIEGEADFTNDIGTYTGFYPDGGIKMKGQMEGDRRIEDWTLYDPDGSLTGTYTPIYEDEKPIFKTRVSKDINTIENKERLDKPDYKYKRRGLRYFNSRINEYRAVILGTNPFWLTNNELPLALEYYMQERLGYELQVRLLRDPFFVSTSDIPVYQISHRGAKLSFRQKLYHEDKKLGMFYFGHQISYKFNNFHVNHLDTTIVNEIKYRDGNLIESGFGYGIFIGNRWMRDVGDSGLTVDSFIGIQIAGRSYQKRYENDNFAIFDPYFDPKIQSSLYFPIIFGINIGFAAPDNKSKTQ